MLAERKRVALQWATGVGKGYTAVRAIQQLKPKKTLIVVAETAHKKNWADEINKAGGLDEFDMDVTMECYASLKNYKDTSWDLIIFDEAHHLGSDLRLDIISTIKSNMVLLLSATMDYELQKCLDFTFGKFSVMTITIQDAIESGMLPTPRIVLIPLTLDYQIKDQTIEESWGRAAKRKTIKCTMKESWKYKKNKAQYPDMHLIIECSAYEKYNHLSDMLDFWMKRYSVTRNEVFKQKALSFGSQRKVFMGELKTNYVKKLLKELDGKRYICFCTNIKQAEELGGTNAIHSKKADNQTIINSFNNKEINSLFAVGMAQEGMNLNDIQAGIIVQLDGKERPFIQKFGRTMRADSPVQYIFYFRFTQDEKWLEKVIGEMDKSYIVNYEIHD